MEDINLLELKEEESAESKAMLENVDSKLDQSVDSEICKVIKTAVGEDGTEIATEIKHFSHEHHLKLTDDEVPNNKICDGKYGTTCGACWEWCNGLYYSCDKCYFRLNVQCSLTSYTFTHACHEHRLYLSITNHEQKCSICGSERDRVFRCTTCDFVLDFKCATLPQTAWYNQHGHPFALWYTPEDDSNEYYCDICEEERDPKQWFYYCENCSFPAHSKCIIGEYPNHK